LVEILNEKIAALTTIVEPFAKIGVPPKYAGGGATKYLSQFSGAVGLALREEEGEGQGV
jgi:hypothetical protein